MRHTFLITVLLLFVLIFTVSCHKEKPEKIDYYKQAVIAYKEGDIEQARNNILLYMLNYDNTMESTRQNAVVLYTSLGFPDSLNITVLNSSDCIEGRITLYKSYAALGQIQKANDILESYIHGYLPTGDYALLIVNYPTDPNYTLSVLKQWNMNIKDSDKDMLLDLTLEFIKQGLSDKTAKSALEFAELLLNDDYCKSDNVRYAKVYKIMAILLDDLYDVYNSSRYWRMVKILNPQDPDLSGSYVGQT